MAFVVSIINAGNLTAILRLVGPIASESAAKKGQEILLTGRNLFFMNTNTGEMFEVPPGRTPQMPSVPLTGMEARLLRPLHTQERLRGYKRMHADDDCRSCGKKLRFHTLREFQTCYSE